MYTLPEIKLRAMKGIVFSLIFPLLAADPIKTLWNRLDPGSAAQALAFYELYPESAEAKMALARASRILTGSEGEPVHLLASYLQTFKTDSLTKEARDLIARLSDSLPNRKLKGFKAQSEAEVLALASDEIDLGRALLLSQLDGKEEALEQIESYCTLLDMMALQILAELPPNATPREKITAANQLIFEKMHFRFPPHSIYAKEIDLYTFLPSVMDNHLGVCLGVAALYLAVAQRIGLPLEAITPPGHIYVRYREGDTCINIETTARGIDIPTEHYLNVNTKSLSVRTLREVVGMTHVNQASLYLQNEEYEQALRCYEKARLYMGDDPLVKELLGFCYVFVGREEEGKKLLKEVKDVIPNGAIVKGTLVEDYLSGEANAEAIQVVFTGVDEKRESILKKQKRLQKVLTECPRFREGIEQLAISWIQLNRPKEALSILKTYHEIDPFHPVIEYYLAVLHGMRQDYAKCWTYLKNSEAIVKTHDFYPKALRELRKELIMVSPE